jgi:ACS family tartrate transporter-like MFS transporter
MGEQDRVFAKCAWRLVPFMMLLYVVNYIDRVNVGFAALTMNKDMGFSPAIFGFGAGLFFLGYLLFQVPMSVGLERVGARRSIFAILAIWGVISAGTAFVQGPLSFYALRFLLGVAEAGFFPVMLVYLTHWFPRSYSGRFTAVFMTAIPLSSIIGGPLSGFILSMQGIAGLAGWQWMFLIEGIPACLLAFAVLVFLPDGPNGADWLTAEEKARIAARVAEDDAARERDVWAALRDPRVVALGLVNFAILFSSKGVQLWLPQIVQGMGFSIFATGFIVSLAYLASVPAMVLWGRSSDLKDERLWHVAIPALLAAGAFVVASLSPSAFLTLFAITIAAIGLTAILPAYFSLLSSFLSGPAAAGGIAMAIAIGNLGSFAGPSIVGVLRQLTGDFTAAMMSFAIAMGFGAAIVLGLGRALKPRRAPAPAGISGRA